MDFIERLQELLSVSGISGFEQDVADDVCKRLKEYCSDAQITASRSVFGVIEAKEKDAPTVMLEAHLDRIGLIVKSVDENGFLGFDTLGGVDERLLPGAEVRVLGKEPVFGVVGAKPPHITGKDESEKGLDTEDMLIDTGLGKRTADLIKVGDPILLDSKFCRLLNGRVSAGALDNRVSVSAIFEILEKLRHKELPVNVMVAFTSGEEMGLYGAYTIIAKREPDLAVVLDVTYGRTPDAQDDNTFPLGCGAVICRGPNVHYEMTKKAIDIAKKKDIPYEIEVASKSTGTTAWAIQTSGSGVPCIVLSIPLKFMHTTVETVDVDDVKNVCKLVEEIICGGEVIA